MTDRSSFSPPSIWFNFFVLLLVCAFVLFFDVPIQMVVGIFQKVYDGCEHFHCWLVLFHRAYTLLSAAQSNLYTYPFRIGSFLSQQKQKSRLLNKLFKLLNAARLPHEISWKLYDRIYFAVYISYVYVRIYHIIEDKHWEIMPFQWKMNTHLITCQIFHQTEKFI